MVLAPVLDPGLSALRAIPYFPSPALCGSLVVNPCAVHISGSRCVVGFGQQEAQTGDGGLGRKESLGRHLWQDHASAPIGAPGSLACLVVLTQLRFPPITCVSHFLCGTHLGRSLIASPMATSPVTGTQPHTSLGLAFCSFLSKLSTSSHQRADQLCSLLPLGNAAPRVCVHCRCWPILWCSSQ